MDFLENNGIRKPSSIICDSFIMEGHIYHEYINNKNDMMNNIKNIKIDMLDCILVKINGSEWHDYKDELKLNVILNGHIRSEEQDYMTCQKIYPFMCKDVFEYMGDFLLSLFKQNHANCMFFPLKTDKKEIPLNLKKIDKVEIGLNKTYGIDSIDIYYFGRCFRHNTGLIDDSIDDSIIIPNKMQSSELMCNNSKYIFNDSNLVSNIKICGPYDSIDQIFILVEFESKNMIEFADVYFENIKISNSYQELLNIPVKYIFDFYKNTLGLTILDFSYDNKLIIPFDFKKIIEIEHIVRIIIHDMYFTINIKSFNESFRPSIMIKYNSLFMDRYDRQNSIDMVYTSIEINDNENCYKLSKRRLMYEFVYLKMIDLNEVSYIAFDKNLYLIEI